MELASDFLVPSASVNEEELSYYISSQKFESMEAGQTYHETISVSDLDHVRFEALIAQLWTSKGYESILTPRSGDRGIDVIAIKDDEIELIQAKKWDSPIGVSAVEELPSGFEFYRSRLFPQTMKRFRHKLTLVTNNSFARETIKKARKVDVTLIDGKELGRLQTAARPTIAQLEEQEMRRCVNLSYVQTRLEGLVGK